LGEKKVQRHGLIRIIYEEEEEKEKEKAPIPYLRWALGRQEAIEMQCARHFPTKGIMQGHTNHDHTKSRHFMQEDHWNQKLNGRMCWSNDDLIMRAQ
jgi:hypothetical protein